MEDIDELTETIHIRVPLWLKQAIDKAAASDIDRRTGRRVTAADIGRETLWIRFADQRPAEPRLEAVGART